MKQRFLLWGLTSIAFVVTLALLSWHEGLWPADETPTRGNRSATLTAADPVLLPAQPFGPTKPAPAVATQVVAATTPPQPQAPQQPEAPVAATETPPPMPVAEAEVDRTEFLSRRDRAAPRGARSH